MTLEKLAMEAVEAVESAGVEFMIVGAMAAGLTGCRAPPGTWICLCL